MISVIIPMYNSRDTIIDAIKSIENQSKYNEVEEIIIIDDGSIDNSIDVINDYIKETSNNKIKVFTKKNGGVSSARNLGIKNAKSEWIALLDSDDKWLPLKLEKQLKAIKKYPDIVFIGTGRDNENVTFGKKICDGLYSLNISNLLFKPWPHTSTVLIKKDVLIEMGLFDEKRRYAEDGQLWLKIAKKYPIYYLSQSLELAKNDKNSFGKAGLSSNIKMMHLGCKSNIKEAYMNKSINIIQKLFFSFYEDIKYIRRVVITRFL